jgi:hypothetical protein
VRRVPNPRKILNATVMRQFFFRIFPIAPTCKIFARLNMDVTPNARSKLMDNFSYLNRLKDGKGMHAIMAAH